LFDVVGHLIHGEKTDWIPRAEIILTRGESQTFVPFDRLAQFEDSNGKSLPDLLTEFSALRKAGISKLQTWNLTTDKLELKGMHPELGEVTLEQLLSTWVVHDLNHIRQIVKYIADQYAECVGPWRQYLSILE
ncbi:MAG: DinB family protein, partial [Candidatus Binatia bacterium]